MGGLAAEDAWEGEEEAGEKRIPVTPKTIGQKVILDKIWRMARPPRGRIGTGDPNIVQRSQEINIIGNIIFRPSGTMSYDSNKISIGMRKIGRSKRPFIRMWNHAP
jgi:hypothetical protein